MLGVTREVTRENGRLRPRTRAGWPAVSVAKVRERLVEHRRRGEDFGQAWRAALNELSPEEAVRREQHLVNLLFPKGDEAA